MPSFDFTSQGRKPSVPQIIKRWKDAGHPRAFDVEYGETFARFELIGRRWDDSGNGCRGVNRNAVVTALQAFQMSS